MSKRITRRKALTSGAFSTGILLGSTYTKSEAAPLYRDQEYLMPWSPPENLKRDLTPGTTHIRLSCSSYKLHYTKGMDITGSVKKIRDMGYTAAEGSDEWKNASDSDIRELKTALKTFDLMFYTLHLSVNNIHPDLSERKKINRRVVEMIETAERIGLSFIVTHTGSCSPDPGCPHRDNWTQETWKTSVSVLRQICKDTSGCKVDLAVEAINTCNINNPRAHVKLKEDVGDPRIKVTLDPQNMMNMNVYYRSTELINECFDLLGEDICYAHCKDVLLKPNMLPAFEWVVVGTGTMDYETYLTRLSRLKYPRVLFLEFLPTEKYPEAKRFIEETVKKVGVKIYS